MQQAIQNRSFFSIFYFFICLYNSNAEKFGTDNIAYRTTFIATKSGSILASVLALISVILSFILLRSNAMQLIVVLPTIIGIYGIALAFRVSNIRYRTKIFPSIVPINPVED